MPATCVEKIKAGAALMAALWISAIAPGLAVKRGLDGGPLGRTGMTTVKQMPLILHCYSTEKNREEWFLLKHQLSQVCEGR